MCLTVFALLVALALPGVATARPDEGSVAVDYSGDKTETIFFVLGMLDEYGGRRITEGIDQIEHFYPNEVTQACVFRVYLDRLAAEQGLNPTVDVSWGESGYISFMSPDLSRFINAQYQFTSINGYRVVDGEKRRLSIASISTDQFDGHGTNAKLAYLAGAYFRYGQPGNYTFSNANKKRNLIAQLLEDVGCKGVRKSSREGIPFDNRVYFDADEQLAATFARLPGIWALAAADTLLGFVTNDELQIYREFIGLAQNGAFDDCVLTAPCTLDRFISPWHPSNIPQPEPWVAEAIAFIDSLPVRPASVVELQSDSVLVANRYVASGDTSWVSLNRVGFDHDRTRALLLCWYFNMSPGRCSQMLSVYLRKQKDLWEVTSFASDKVQWVPADKHR
ncbi:MAG TPA: hypothetical protein VFX92_03090 [Candidatus Krumholzibacteria bacterium]|nr:hypothetical protein [Candidatus Krumholzibacteria bacterium]